MTKSKKNPVEDIFFKAVDVKHSCCYGNRTAEPEHTKEFIRHIETVVNVTLNLNYGFQKNTENNGAISSNFDIHWINAMNKAGWKSLRSIDFKEHKMGKKTSDALLEIDGQKIVFEIEKSEPESIWMDIMKIIAHLKYEYANYGMIIAPTNYCHSKGEYSLFEYASQYMWYCDEIASIDRKLLSKIAIIGYTQKLWSCNEQPFRLLGKYSTRLRKLIKDVSAMTP